MNYKQMFTGLVSLAAMFVAMSANAANVEVKNEVGETLEVTVEPADGSILPSSNDTKFDLPAAGTKKLTLTKESLNNKETFSITGSSKKTVHMPSLYNKCGPISLDKDYKIIFTEGKAGGIICVIANKEAAEQK